MKLNYKIITPIILIGVITSMIVYSNMTALTPAQLQEKKETAIKEELKTTITPLVKTEKLIVNPVEIISPITKKTELESKSELVTYKPSDKSEFDLRAKINGTDKELPFKNIATLDWINKSQVLIVAYDTLKDPTSKNYIYKINPEDKEQGVYIYNVVDANSIKIWNKPVDNLFYQARVGNIGLEKVIILNTTQTIEVINLKGEKIKTLFYNLDIKENPKSYISFDIKQPDSTKFNFEVLGLIPNTKKYSIEL